MVQSVRLNLNKCEVLHLVRENINLNSFLEGKMLKNAESFCHLGLTDDDKSSIKIVLKFVEKHISVYIN